MLESPDSSSHCSIALSPAGRAGAGVTGGGAGVGGAASAAPACGGAGVGGAACGALVAQLLLLLLLITTASSLLNDAERPVCCSGGCGSLSAIGEKSEGWTLGSAFSLSSDAEQLAALGIADPDIGVVASSHWCVPTASSAPPAPCSRGRRAGEKGVEKTRWRVEANCVVCGAAGSGGLSLRTICTTGCGRARVRRTMCGRASAVERLG
jgi:hypothetical protein